MALNILEIQPTFNNISGQIGVDDQTNYPSQGIPLDGTYNVRGYLSVNLTSSTGTSVIYNNIGGTTPDIDLLVGTTSTLPILLPKDSYGNILWGTYDIVYNVIVSDPDQVDVIIANVTQGFSYTYEQEVPKVCLTADVNCQGATITSYDSTNYGAYATVTRVHNLFPPPVTGAATITGTGSSLSSGSPIYDQTWTQEVISQVSYTFPSGLIAIIELQGSREIPVVCDLGMTKIFCCIKKVFERYNSLLAKNTVRALDMHIDTVVPMLEAMVMYNAAVAAGNTNGAAKYYQLTIDISGCGEDCGCNSTEPQLIQPNIGSSNVTIVESPDNSINVVPIVDGITTTYQIQVSAALQAALAALKNVIVDTDTPAQIEVLASTVGNTITYKVNFKGSSALPYSILIDRLLIDTSTTGTSPADYLSIVTQEVVNSGSNIAPTVNHTILLGETVPNASTDVAVIQLTNILVDPTKNYTVSANMESRYSTPLTTSMSTIASEVLYANATSGSIYLRLINPITGQPYTLGQLNASSFGNLYITLTINSAQ